MGVEQYGKGVGVYLVIYEMAAWLQEKPDRR